MNDDGINDAVLRLLQMLADRLESYLEGDELAFETLGEALEQAGFGGEELQATALLLRSLSGEPSGAAEPIEAAPGKDAQRVPSDEERARLSPEAWGYLLALQRRGSLDSEQFERVVDLLVTSGVRRVGVDQVRDVATRVALQFDETGEPGDAPHDAIDLPH
jgi:uncharacterized protein Smg (DUF494 family)